MLARTKPTPRPRVAVVATLDTKADLALHARGILRSLGCDVELVDVGIREPQGVTGHSLRVAASNEVGRRAVELFLAGERRSALDHMVRALGEVLHARREEGTLSGVLVLGGSRGTYIGCQAAGTLPPGFPKVAIGPVFAGETSRFIGASDIVMVPSVADLIGLNPITRRAIEAGSRIVATLASAQVGITEHGHMVSITAIGATTPAAEALVDLLGEAGWEPTVYSPTGVGGAAFETSLEGTASSAVDLTTRDLLDELLHLGVSAVRTARVSIGTSTSSRVLSVGGVDMLIFGPRDQVPAEYTSRVLVEHSGAVTLVRTNSEELVRYADALVARASSLPGRASIVVPMGGFSDYDRPGLAFHDPHLREVLLARLRQKAPKVVEVSVVPEHINSAEFARHLRDEHLRLVKFL